MVYFVKMNCCAVLFGIFNRYGQCIGAHIEGMNIKVVENSPSMYYIVLPDPESVSDEVLAAASGGSSASTASSAGTAGTFLGTIGSFGTAGSAGSAG